MTTCENFAVYSHQRIRHEMYDGAGTASQGAAMAGWHELAGRLTAIRHYLDAAIGGVQESRHGAAAAAAAGSIVPLGSWMDEAQRLVHDTRDRIGHQISGFTTARDSIPEVPAEPRGWGWQDFPVIDSFIVSDQEADEAVTAEQQRQARAAMMAYQNGTNERVVGVARFTPPPAGRPDITVPAGIRSGIGALPGGVGGWGGAGGTQQAVVTPPVDVTGGAPDDLSGTPPAPTGPQRGGGPATPEHSAAPMVPVGTIGGAAPGGAAPGGAAPGGAAPGGAAPGSAAPGGAAPGSAAPGTAALRGPRGTAARRVPPGGTRYGADRGAGQPGSADSPAVRRPGGAGSGRGTGPGSTETVAPFGPASGGRGAQDEQRPRPSYLLEADSNRLIGDLPPTAPAVLGADPADAGLPHDDPARADLPRDDPADAGLSRADLPDDDPS